MTSGITRFRKGNLILGGDLRADNIDALFMRGAANAKYVHCVPTRGSHTAFGDLIFDSAAFDLRTYTTANFILGFVLPLPTTLGSLKLYIKNVRVGLTDADASNFITYVRQYGMASGGNTLLENNDTDLNTVDDHELTFSAHDCSGYNAICLAANCINGTSGNLNISYVAVQCYYDT